MAYHSCKNCNHPFGSSYKYCPNCGLKQSDELTVKSLFNNTIQNYLAFDARFFKSFIPLLTKPGYLPKKFIDGKRLTFLHPAQLYLFSTILFFFLFSFQVNTSAKELDADMKDLFYDSPKKEVEVTDQYVKDSLQKNGIKENLKSNRVELPLTEKELDSIADTENEKEVVNFNSDFHKDEVDSLIAINASDKLILKEMGLKKSDGFIRRQGFKQFLKFYKSPKGGSIYKYFIQSIPIALFFVLPIFALLLRLFYYKYKSYAHHLVFSFYYFAFIFFTFSIIMFCNYIYDIPDELDLLIIMSCLIYLVIAIKSFYEKKWISTFFKSILLITTYCLFVLPVGGLITLLLSFLFY